MSEKNDLTTGANEASTSDKLLPNPTTRERWEQERERTIEFFRLVNTSRGTRQLLEAALSFFTQHSHCEAVAIRTRDGSDFPYFQALGFSPEFLQAEHSLCATEHSGEPVPDAEGNVTLECRCGDVICGRFDPSRPYFTQRGSFWTNSVTDLQLLTAQEEHPTRRRGRCAAEGYESVTLIPLKTGDETLGLLQLNDKRQGMFSLETIELWERLADHLAVALAKTQAEARLQAGDATLHSIFENLDQGLVVADRDGRILHWNPSALRMHDLPTSPDNRIMLNEFTRIFELSTLDGRVLSLDEWPISRILRGERLHHKEYQVRRLDRDDWKRVISYGGTTFFDAGGNTVLAVLTLSDITEQKKAEEALRQSEERARTLFDTISGKVVINELTPDGVVGRFLEVNDEFCQRLGYTREEMLTMSPEDIDDPSSGYSAADAGAQLRENKEVLFDQNFVAKDGTLIPVEIHAHLLTLGKKPAVIATVRDLSHRRRVERALRESEERLSQAVNLAHLGSFQRDHISGKYHCSEIFESMIGVAEQDLTDEAIFERVYPDDREAVARVMKRSYDPQGTPLFRLEHRIVRPEGIRWVLVRGETFFEGEGDARHPVRTVGAVVDVTPRKTAELEFFESQQQLRTALDAAKLGVWSRDLKTGIMTGDAMTRSIFGWPEGEVITTERMLDSIVPEERERFSEHRARQSAGKQSEGYNVEYRILRPDRSVRWVSISGCLVRDISGEPARLIGVVQDITERKQSEIELRASQASLRTALDVAILGTWSTDIETGVIDGDELARSIFGWPEGVVATTQMLMDRIVPEDRERFRERQSALIAGLPARALGIEYCIQLPDGSVRWVSARGNLVRGNDGKPLRLTGVVQDITDRKRAEKDMHSLEQQLLHAQKMGAIGRLAGGIAHDFNNLLMVIRSHTEIMQEYIHSDDRLRKNTQAIMKASDRAASLTGQMLAFSRKQVLSPIALELNAAVAEAAKMLTRLIGEDIELRVVPAESAWVVRADPDQISQVLMNLSVNARDAMPNGGTLTIETRNFTTNEDFIAKYPFVLPGEYAVLTVTDTGTGIPKELQERIFEPFFTTKSVGKGTGLGLSTVYGIVKQSGGYLFVDSEMGVGSCFTIYLPKVKDAVAGSTRMKAVKLERGTETLLVVEDEAALRDSVSEFLGELGYKVLSAESGMRALEIAAEFDDPIHLMISDVVMPKMSGRELAQMLVSLRPMLKTIFMSGYTDDAIVRHGVQDEGVAFLQKPFSLATLSRKIREVLAGDPRNV